MRLLHRKTLAPRYWHAGQLRTPLQEAARRWGLAGIIDGVRVRLSRAQVPR